jgi:hypothetical protein
MEIPFQDKVSIAVDVHVPRWMVTFPGEKHVATPANPFKVTLVNMSPSPQAASRLSTHP